MTLNEFNSCLEATGILFDPDHPDHITAEKEGGLIPAPFLEYDVKTKHIYADGQNYLSINEISLRLYDDIADDSNVGIIESALVAADLRYKISNRSFDANTGLWATEFNFQI